MTVNEFETMPHISDDAKKELTKSFTSYLFFESIKKGVRKYTCTACGQTFKNGEAVLQRTERPQDRALWYAKTNETCECPLCGAETIVQKIENAKKLTEYAPVCIFLAASPDNVWIRCFSRWQSFDQKITGETTFYEVMRYHLQPGKAESWDRYNSNHAEWYKNKMNRDAFIWNHGYYCEKYSYTCFEDNMQISDTFLKYHSFNHYEYYHGIGLPFIKYLCWYAVHPQIEMLAKLHHYKTIDQMIFGNTDIKTILDWNAKKPWDLYRLPKEVYTVWREKHHGDMRILKLYHAIKGNTAKDLIIAEQIYAFNNYRLKNSKKMSMLARRYNTTCKEIIHYCEKVSRNSAGSCHHCPGITTHEAYQTWLDYINMAEVIGTNKTISVFPSNLKAAHDRLVVSHKYHCEQMTLSELKKQAEKEAARIRKRYPKVDKIYGSIQEKYAYTDGNYSIIVPSCIEDAVLDGLILDHCTNKADIYYDRISSKESFLLFLRNAKTPDKPWYTLEVEPGGTIRQKRTTGDKQKPDLEKALPFLKKWQQVVSERLTKSDRNLAKKSQQLRKEGYAELKRTKKIIHYGALAGKLLADVLEADLMEVGTA